MNAVPPGVERNHPLARLTTVRTGGPGDFFARADSAERLTVLLGWADREQIAVGVVGSGSNLLIADAGFRGLVMKLDGALARIEQGKVKKVHDRTLKSIAARLQVTPEDLETF
jgi:UDP-N-acetylenolpyruvoylglucosamine reductase